MADFFDSESVLEDNSTRSLKQSVKGIDVDSYVSGITGKFKALAYFYNMVKFGRVSDGKLAFFDGTDIDMDDLLELRIFNNDAEHHIKRKGLAFDVQVITDGAEGGEVIEYVDSKSNIFGDCLEVANGYAKLWEEGRKIAMSVPVDEKASHYAVKTRSYITYDNDTNQAGFGYYRFLDIVNAERGE